MSQNDGRNVEIFTDGACSGKLDHADTVPFPPDSMGMRKMDIVSALTGIP